MPVGQSTFGSGNYLGSDFGFLRNEYKNLYESGSPLVDQFVTGATKRIGMQSRSAKESIEEQGARSGFRGASANLYNALFEKEAQAISDVNLQGAQMQERIKQQALSQLVGLSQTEGRTNLDVDRQQELIRQYEKTFEENKRQFGLEYALRQRELDLREAEQAGGGFLGVLGGAIGGIAGIATGGLASGIGSWLGNQAGSWLDSQFFSNEEDLIV